APAPPCPDVTSGDGVDDLVDPLGLGDGADRAGNAQGTPGLPGDTGTGGVPVPPPPVPSHGLCKGRARIQELLGGGSTGKALEQPGRAEFRPDPKEQEAPEPEGRGDRPGFPFGSYEPSVASGTVPRRG
ncbi:FBF1 factor, partial [Chaetops frenatus]|nr:FBF1 factor [Chaetops frenatus]